MRSNSSSNRSHPYSQRRARLLQDRARAMRASPTFAEQKLWETALRGSNLGVSFRRQVPVIGRYVADFAAPAARLIVEVDGPHHARRRPADARRDERLRCAGWRVVRVPEELVRKDFAAAVALVVRALEESALEVG